MHLITIVDKQSYAIPYLTTKKFKWISEKQDHQKLFLPISENEDELGFVDLIVKVAFHYQSYLVENLASLLMSAELRHSIASGTDPDKPITLSVVLMLDLIRAIDQALKMSLIVFRQKPQLLLVHTINNYLGLLRHLKKVFPSLLESLGNVQKLETCTIIQNLTNTVSDIYSEIKKEFPSLVSIVTQNMQTY